MNTCNKGKILALDYGASSLGVAISDESQQMAFGRGVIDRKKGFRKVAQALKDLCEKERVVELIVGLPLDAEGGETEQTEAIRRFAGKIEKAMPDLRISFQDEAFTSFEANQFLAEMAVKPLERKSTEDELAAIFILQRYLEKQR